jgi:prepilin-type N-terminal cleavage/methylation domain-containing protein
MQKPHKKAFTLLELIFVIVILGIVASIGSELIAKVYGQYIIQRAQHRASLKTELAALQIANRLAAAIPGTVVRKDSNGGSVTEGIEDAMSLGGDSYHILQWVGADMDSFSTSSTPGWSGFADVDDAANSATSLATPGSDLNLTKEVVENLAGGSLPSGYNSAILFPYDSTSYPIDLSASASAVDTLTLTGTGAAHIAEHYKLAWTSYALSVETETIDGKTYNNLYLYYQFDPIRGWTIPSNAKKSLLLRNISTFKFKGAGRTIRFKICKEERIGEDFNITSCKEKAVF